MFHDIMTNGINKLRFEDSTMATSLHATEDTGFCSGEDYMENEVHSPTDSSEDSVEVKVSAISFKKRKLTEDFRKDSAFTGPLKKRMCLKIKAEANDASEKVHPFRPWSPSKTDHVPVVSNASKFAVPFPIKLEPAILSPVAKPDVSAFSYFRPPSPIKTVHQVEPVSLVIKREKDEYVSTKSSDVRVPDHPQITKLTAAETERMILKTNEQFPALKMTCQPTACPSSPYIGQSNNNNVSKKQEAKREQRNYKNMTRERRIEANARERTRVHTISAAFDTLRRAVPSYSHNQKLSKLSVLRIACSYIMTLSSLVNDDEGTSSEPPTSECVDLVSRTIQREGKLRKKKDDND